MPGSDHFHGDLTPEDLRPDAKSAGDGPVADRDVNELAAERDAMRERDLAAAKLEAAERDAPEPPRDLMKELKKSLDDVRRSDPETMPVDLDETERVDANAVRSTCTGDDDSDRAEPIDRAALRRRIAEQLHKASPPPNDVPMALLSPIEREPYETAADMVLDVMPASVQTLKLKATRASRHALSLSEELAKVRERLEAERQARRQAEDQGLSALIENRAARAAARSDANVAHSRAVQALAEYLRDGSVSSVGRSVARPWILGEQGRYVDDDSEPTDPTKGLPERVEPGMDPERLRALAFAVAAAGEAIDATRRGVTDRLERKAFALQLSGQLDDVEIDMVRILERHGITPEDDASLVEHMRRTRDIIRELDSGYDAPSWDRGITL